MSKSQIAFRGIAPVYSPLSLRLGVDQFAKKFIAQLQQLELDLGKNKEHQWQGQFFHLGGEQSTEQSSQLKYQSTKDNSKDVRLMCWSPQKDETIIFHVFANHISVVETELTIDLDDLPTDSFDQDMQTAHSAEALVAELEKQVQQRVKQQIDSYLSAFNEDLKHLHSMLSAEFIYVPELPSSKNEENNDNWVARTMLLNDEQIGKPALRSLLTYWLKKTSRPEDAAKIINGEKECSMTWLNYAVKNPQVVGKDNNIQIMVLAQYYYVAQENCNNALRGAIEQAYNNSRHRNTDKLLANTRTASRLNQIAFYEYIKFLTRPNRVLLEDILNGWKFEQLVENSERMIEICNARLQEEDNKRREKSTVMTDFLLVALSFFTVFELSLYLTEFSREMMSRPTLDYNDSKSSFFLSYIAEIDADIMFSFGFGLTLMLIIVYRYIKRN